MTHRSIVTRDELIYLLNLERAFVERWLGEGMDGIPALPHIPGIGKGTRFHLATVEDWLLKHFQKGGDPSRERRGV